MTLAMDDRLSKVPGGDYIPTFMGMGLVVLGFLSIILMFYTNSFLMKQRKREFGIYNILGMEKRHVGKVLFHETMMSSTVSIVLGLALGVLFYKFSSLLICKLLAVDIIIGFYFITPKTLVPTALFFILIDLLTYLFNRISIAKMKPIELLQSKSAGEKEPKVKWPLFIIGILTLVGGYYISVTTESPLKALYLFFGAVILVIIGTYSLFVTGSIFVLKVLKKNEKFYYNKKHMPAISGLLYRMKQNAVGLASIAILATGVLVMISTTVSLYSGMQQTLEQNYPQHYYISTNYFDENDHLYNIPADVVQAIIKETADKYRLKIDQMVEQNYLEVSYTYHDGELITDRSSISVEDSLEGLSSFTYITEATFTKLGGEKLNLHKNEVAIYSFSSTGDFNEKSILLDGNTYSIVEKLNHFPIQSPMATTVKSYGVVVSDASVMETIYQGQKEAYGDYASEYENRIAVTFSDKEKAMEYGKKIDRDIQESMYKYVESKTDGTVYLGGTFSLWEAREAVYGLYGTLLFLGILLGLVCLFSTALIIYYKQISEGYEDRHRFQIMQKIGMSKEEVKKTIREQIILVFFLPLIVAGIHL